MQEESQKADEEAACKGKIKNVKLETVLKQDRFLYDKKLSAKAGNEVKWINRVDAHAGGNAALTEWNAKEVKGDMLLSL